LKLKEGELKGKEEIIENLNVKFDKLQSKLDPYTHDDNCHNRINPLQSVVDNLTSKIIELENEIKSLKDKAAKEL
jgi:outer membrane murein-binding lipoprotein Lpp